MGTFGWILGFLIPWLTGTMLCIRLLPSPTPGAWGWRLGYGYLLGMLLMTLLLRIESLLGGFSFWVSIALCAALVAGLYFWRRHQGLPKPAAFDASLGNSGKLIGGLLIAWLAVHGVGMLAEQAVKPIYAWDAWAQWATKAKVWFSQGHIVPFANPADWLAGKADYTDAAAHYPGLVPLLQVWTALSLGRWDDALVNLPWFGLWLSLVLATWGHARAWPLPPLTALGVTVVVGTLPFVGIHVMLAGYADLPQAVVYTLAALATIAWTRTKATHHAVTAILLLLACPFVKQPGIVWVATLLPAFLIAWRPNLGLKLTAALAGGAVLVIGALSQMDVTVLSYRLHMEFSPVWESLLANLVLFSNWNLLFWLLPVALLLGHREIRKAEWLPFVATIGFGIGFLSVVFFFTNAAAWVEDLSTVNRAILHLAPLLAFFTATLIGSVLAGVSRSVPEAAASTSPTPTNDNPEAAPATPIAAEIA